MTRAIAGTFSLVVLLSPLAASAQSAPPAVITVASQSFSQSAGDSNFGAGWQFNFSVQAAQSTSGNSTTRRSNVTT